MKFVRYKTKNDISYGILENNIVKELEGSIFDEYILTQKTYELSEIQLLSPVQPSQIICVGQEHIMTNQDEIPLVPTYNAKPPSAVVGPDENIVYPEICKNVSHKGQLAVIIKDKIRNISEEDAMNHVLGYTCFNDIIDLELTKVAGQWFRAQAFDTFAPFGPCVETNLDPSGIEIKTIVNDVLVSVGKCGKEPFSIPYIIHYLSQAMTLFPGDIISTGTPIESGSLQPGDVVEVKIEGIGTLRNPVYAA